MTLNRLLGIDNCIECSDKKKLPGELLCAKYKKKLEINCYGVPIKIDCCTKPFKYDFSDENDSDEEMYV